MAIEQIHATNTSRSKTGYKGYVSFVDRGSDDFTSSVVLSHDDLVRLVVEMWKGDTTIFPDSTNYVSIVINGVATNMKWQGNAVDTLEEFQL